MRYSLRKGSTLGLLKTHSFYYSKNAVHFFGFLIWNNIPAIPYLNSKTKLEILEILIADF